MPKLVPAGMEASVSQRGRWWRWRGYTVRWLLFSEIVQLFQPVADGDAYWSSKLEQALLGLAFGAVCALVFTASENTYNPTRVNWKSWLIVALTWIAVKVVFVSVMSALT